MFSKRLVGRLAVLSAPAGATCIVPAQAAMADQLQETTQMESRLSDKARHDIALNAVDGTSNTVVFAASWHIGGFDTPQSTIGTGTGKTRAGLWAGLPPRGRGQRSPILNDPNAALAACDNTCTTELACSASSAQRASERCIVFPGRELDDLPTELVNA